MYVITVPILLLSALLVNGLVNYKDSNSVQDILNGTDDHIRANTGTFFKHISKLVTNRDQLSLSVVVKIPDLKELVGFLSQNRFSQLENTCSALWQPTNQAQITYMIKSACITYNNLHQVFNQTLQRTRLTMADKLATLQEYIPTLAEDIENIIPNLTGYTEYDRKMYMAHQMNRTKRALPLLIPIGKLLISGVQAGLSIYRTHHLKKRVKTLTHNVDYLLKSNDKLLKNSMHMDSRLNALAINVKNGFTAIHSSLITIDHRLDKLTNTVERNMLNIGTLSHTQKLLSYSTNAQINQMLILNALNDLAKHCEIMLTDLVNSFHLLQLGKLPRSMVSISDLENILAQAATELLVTHPEYEIAPIGISEYYKMDTIIYALTENSVIINIPVLLVEKDSTMFDLYQLQTFHVPTNVLASNSPDPTKAPSSFTRIETEYTYIGIRNDVYVLLSPLTLQDCTKIQGILFCEDLIIHIHRDSKSCVSSLFWKNSMDIITAQCNIKYYHDITPTPKVFEDSTQLLITNFFSEWRLLCNGQDPFPTPLNGMRYMLISKNSICHCKIVIGKLYYLPQSHSDCETTKLDLQVQHPVNSIMLFNLRHTMQQLTDNFDYYATYVTPKNFKVPLLKIHQHMDESHILHEKKDTGIPLGKVIDLISTDQTAYLTAEDLLISQQHIDQWFDQDSIEMSTILIMAILGTLCTAALVLFIIYYCRNHRHSLVLMSSLYAMAKQAEATIQDDTNYGIPEEPIRQEPVSPYLFEIRFRIKIIVWMIISGLIFQLVMYIYKKHLKYTWFIPPVSKQTLDYKSHLFIEITSQQQKQILYLNSIGTSLINILFHPGTRVYPVSYEQHYFSGTLTVRWTFGKYKVNGQKYEYPIKVYVPLSKKFQVQAIMKTINHARLLFLEDVFYAIEGLNNRSLSVNQFKDRHPHPSNVTDPSTKETAGQPTEAIKYSNIQSTPQPASPDSHIYEPVTSDTSPEILSTDIHQRKKPKFVKSKLMTKNSPKLLEVYIPPYHPPSDPV